MNIISGQLRNEREYRELSASIKDQLSSRIPRPARMIGLCEGARNAMISALIEDAGSKLKKKPMLLIVSDEKEAMRSYTALSEMGHALLYSALEIMFSTILPPPMNMSMRGLAY